VRRKLAALGLLIALPLLCDAPAVLADSSDGSCSQTNATFVDSAPQVLGVLGIPDAWAYSTGAGVTVAVVDSGVDVGNVHLGDAVLPGIDLTSDGDGRNDVAGVGTAIAGMIAARQVDSSGMIGIAPEAMILPVRAYQTTDTNNPHQPLADVTAHGIVWAADHGAKIIVVPTPLADDSQTLHAAVDYALANGALTVAAVGDTTTNASNSSDSAPRFPAAYPSVLGVTATGADGTVGSDVVHNETVQVAAYGTNVLSTYFGAGDCYFATEKPSTTYAAGYVGGIAALVAARFPDESPDLWRYRILVTASRPVPYQRDNDIGWGMINAQAALTFVNDGTMVGPPNPLGAPPASATPASPQLIPPVSTGLPLRDRMAIGICAAIVILLFVVVLFLTTARSRPIQS